MHLTPATLEAALSRQFPINTVSWAVATDEVRDMSRAGRELLGLSELHAVRFDQIRSPSDWNLHGVHSIVRFYKMMNGQQQQAFCAQFEHWLDEWTEP